MKVNSFTKRVYLAVVAVTKNMDDEKFLRMMNWFRTGKKVDLKNPKTFNEKILWLNIHGDNVNYSNMTDKAAAKDYAAERIGKEHVIPTVGVWNSFDEIDWNNLPDSFVLKCTHDSGSVKLIKDKSKVDVEKLRKFFTKALKREYWISGREYSYKNIKPRLIAEEYLPSLSGDIPDYKVWCFNGEVKYIQYIEGRNSDSPTVEGFYDVNWQKQEFYFLNDPIEREVEKPECLDKLIECSNTLAEGFPFVRTDFYVLPDGKIYFGEMTFCPNSGMSKWHPEDANRALGDFININ